MGGVMLCVMTLRAELVPDFRLVNVKTNSPQPNAIVSPRDYLLHVSGYYFGGAG